MKKKMKWIIPFAVLAALIIAMVAMATTGAYLSDSNTVAPNDIQAATLQVDVDGLATTGITFNLPNMKPGDQSVKIWAIHNSGSIPATWNPERRLDRDGWTRRHCGPGEPAWWSPLH